MVGALRQHCRGEMRPRARIRTACAAALVVSALVLPADAAAQTLDDFDPGADDAVLSVVVQPDQKVIVAGAFSRLGGGDSGQTARLKIGRLNPDGSIDPTFNPGAALGSAIGQVRALALQPDGKIIVAGVGIADGRNIVRLNADGSVDSTFAAAADGPIHAVALQTNGRIVIGGEFRNVSGGGFGFLARRGIARLWPDGLVDRDFDPGTDGSVRALAIQQDDRILVGGSFTTLGGGGTGTTQRFNIGRLDWDGSIDNFFDAGVGSFVSATMVSALAVQPDEKILVGGRFSTLGDGGSGFSTRYNLGRVDWAGHLDTTFTPALNPPSDSCCEPDARVETLLVLPNRDILVGGQHIALSGDGESLLNLALLDGSGNQYFDFTPFASQTVNALAPQLNGRVVLGGRFWWEDFDLRRHLVRIDVSRPPAGRLVGSGSIGSAWQGSAVAVSADGNTAIVGGPHDTSSRGAAWVWTRSVRTVGTPGAPQVVWTQGPKLVAQDSVGSVVEQGASVALSADGNTAVIGGPNDNGGTGAAWIWTRSGVEWSRRAKLVGANAIGSRVSQGTSVAISADGNTVLVGGPHDNAGVGAVWVWTRTGDTWTPQAGKLLTGDAIGTPWLGISVSLAADGNTAMVGGRADNNWQGAAWVWRRSGGQWIKDGPKLIGSGGIGAFVQQGSSVALSADGRAAIVGGFGDNQFVGAAWMWRKVGAAWQQDGPKLAGWRAINGSSGAQQGMSVSISADGNDVVVGGHSDAGQTGAAWLWTRKAGAWGPRGPKLVAASAVGAAAQGIAVAMSGDGSTVIVGGRLDNGGLGAAWIFAAPSAGTQAPTSVTMNGATLNAVVAANAGSTIRTFASFEYGTTSGFGRSVWVANPVPAGLAPTPVSAATPIGDLSCGTQYRARVIAAGAVTTYGQEVTFTTLACPPSFSVLPPAVGATTATLSATVNPNGYSTTLSFQYGLTPALGLTASTDAGSGTTPVTRSVTLTGLSCQTTYYYRAAVTYNGGTAVGGTATLTTTACVPAVAVTGTPSSVTASTAVFTGTVNPNGVSTSAFFEYGPTTAYGLQVGATPAPGAGTSAAAVSALVSSLACATVYHVRLVATNEVSTVRGSDVTFATAACPVVFPVVVTSAATGVTMTTATLVGSVNPNGSSTTAYFEYGLTTAYGAQAIATSPGAGSAAVTVVASIGGLPCNSLYHFRVVASNAGGVRAGGDLSFSTAACPPGALVITAIVPGNTQLAVLFAPGPDGGLPIANYEFTTDGGSSWHARVPAAISSPLVMTGLTNGTTYGVQIRAVSAAGPGPATPLVSAAPQATPDETADAFNPGADGEVRTIALQTDGRILVGGRFGRLGAGASQPRDNIGRLNPDGTVDAAFNPVNIEPSSYVTAIVVQPDGRILVAGDGPDPTGERTYITRLNADGSLDTSFRGAANGPIRALALQPDGRILIGGAFTAIGLNDEMPRLNFARLNADGSVDAAFDPRVSGEVRAAVVQSDGRIVIGGAFTAVGATLRANLARLNTDGTVDASFDAGAGPAPAAFVTTLALERDGRIVVGGRFATLGGGVATGVRQNIGRLLPGGALDSTFAAGLAGTDPASIVTAALPLTTGRILLGGISVAAAHADGTPRHLVRVTAAGVLDEGFEPRANGAVNALAVQGNAIVVGGEFTAIGGAARARLARLTGLGPSPPVAPAVPAPFTDDPLIAGTTTLRAIHVIELRTRVNTLRQRFGLAGMSWTDPVLTGVRARAVHMLELRAALLQAFDAALLQGSTVPRPVFAEATLGAGMPIRALHVQQLRAAVVLLEGS